MDNDVAAMTGPIKDGALPGAAPDFSNANLRAGVIAHAIKLGKCPPAGCLLSFNAQIQRGDTSMLETGDLSQAEDLTKKIPLRFVVTADDLANARRLIETGKVQHRQPALTILPLGK